MQQTSVRKVTPLPCLRVLVPPLRLLSAAIWQTVQHRIVTAYGLLDDLISEMTEIVPGLLNCRQRCLLCLNLQAQLVLDLCRPGQTINMNTLQPHLDRIQTLSLLLNKEVNNAAEGTSGTNMLMSLIQRLITDPDNRQHFYQDVFPQKYGPKYCKAVELLVMKFLVALERLLVVPNLQQVANMLGTAPSILAECVELPLPAELKSVLEYQKDSIKPINIDVLHVGVSVCKAPPLNPIETSLIEEETLFKAHLLDFNLDTSGREQTVEMAAAENVRMGSETYDKMTGGDCVMIRPTKVKVNCQKEVACNIQENIPSDRCHVALDTFNLGTDTEMPECKGNTAAHPTEEYMPQAMTTGENEHVKVSSEVQSAACIYMEKDSAATTMEHATMEHPANEHRRSPCKSNVAPVSTMDNEESPALQGVGIRPVRKDRGLKMKRFLMMTPKSKSKDTSASKTCQACGKTYSRSSDMRRHQRTHTGERPFQCPQCDKNFQFQYDLKRHNLSVCRLAGLQPEIEPQQTLEEKTANDRSQVYASTDQSWRVSDQEAALHPRGTSKSIIEGTQSLSSHKEVCPITLQECGSRGKEISAASVQKIQPNQAVPKDQKVIKRVASTLLLEGFGTIEKDKCQVEQDQTRQGPEPAAKGIKPILDMVIVPASLDNNYCTNKEQPSIKPTEAKVTNSALFEVVNQTPERCRRAPSNTPPFVCPNCKVKFKSKSALKRHMVTACTVEKMTSTEADGAIQGCKTWKDSKGKKCTRESKPTDSAFHCTKCDISFPDTTRLETHNVIHKPRPCTMCDETFNGFLEVNQHYVDVHHFHGPFPCTFCNRIYPGLKGLITHERVHTSDLPFKCPKCPKAFSYASGLKVHDRMHTKEAPFLCWDCGKGCRTNSALKTHRLCFHSSVQDKRFSCEHCGKSYALKRSMDLHVAKVHAGVRYPCSHCGKLFRSSSSLTRHDLTHTQERPFSCERCAKSFRSASELKVHVRYHTGERPFKCQECGKGFVQSYYLTAHMRMHSGEKPYQCPTCDKCFKSVGTLKRHRLTHTGEKPHKCSVCEMAFSRPELLKSHLRNLHAL